MILISGREWNPSQIAEDLCEGPADWEEPEEEDEEDDDDEDES